MAERLFIGGVKDGQRLEVPPWELEPLCFRLDDGDYCTYRKVDFSAGNIVISVYVAGMITDEMALVMLADGYTAGNREQANGQV